MNPSIHSKSDRLKEEMEVLKLIHFSSLNEGISELSEAPTCSPCSQNAEHLVIPTEQHVLSCLLSPSTGEPLPLGVAFPTLPSFRKLSPPLHLPARHDHPWGSEPSVRTSLVP